LFIKKKPEGVDLVWAFNEFYPTCKIIAISNYTDTPAYYREMLGGINGYLAKSSIDVKLRQALWAVNINVPYVEPSLTAMNFPELPPRRSKPKKTSHATFGLTPLCYTVVRELCKGKSPAGIAKALLKKKGKKCTVDSLRKKKTTVAMAKAKIRDYWNLPQTKESNSDLLIFREAHRLGIKEAVDFLNGNVKQFDDDEGEEKNRSASNG